MTNLKLNLSFYRKFSASIKYGAGIASMSNATEK
jgi:hypothetical protein